ncbi:spondin domain-containing protein [Flagellimonas onchidii]|uniref:spondin domain-containing protein n=1 Tax=Flagellimonas onchidii TaxID=2562684 RepID=UPI0010A6089B|nr:spondin domain-containing protein [Allomuricauda onchidii]
MKKNFFKIMAACLLVAACSEDDTVANLPDNPDEPGGGTPPAMGTVVLNEVEYLGNRVEIYNNSDASVDLGSYWLCLGPGQYSKISDLETEGNVNLGAGEYLSISYNMPEADGGLGLYSSNQFTSSDAIVDFVQWGASGSARENVAVDADLWTVGEYVPVMGNADYSIIYDGDGQGASNWAETTTVTLGDKNVLTVPSELRSIVINEVQFGNRNLIELYNNGNVAADISSYWLCLGPGQYVQLSAATIESGDTNLEAGEFVVVNYDLPNDQGGLGLYSTNEFTNAEAIMDFVQWGASGSARENVAVEAGIWTDGDYVPWVNLTSSIEYDGEGDASTDWNEETIPSFGVSNDTEIASTTFNVTITNAAEVFNVHVFNQRYREGEDVTAGPLNQNNDFYEISFQAVPGTKITPVTMMGNSNDWFLAPEDLSGIYLWENGEALNNVDIADKLVLYDLGTEVDDEPSYFPPAGTNVGPADPNNLVRLVDRNGMRGSDYLTAVLTYEAGDGQSAGWFTLRITAINTANFVVTPGIAVLHANDYPLFNVGEPDRGVGLERIAEDGMPGELYDYYKETGSNGSFLRLSSTRTVFSPGLVYAFNGERDPLVLQGMANPAGNGLEELAEDGVNSIAVDHLAGLGFPAAASDQTAPVGPGQSLTFTIEVPQDQGYRFGFATMFVDTNDWFLAYNNEGYPLFDENGVPASGYGASEKSYLYDAGTEADEAVGFGIYQAPRQSGPNEGPADANTTVRRVSDLEDVQFGKGVYDNGPGVVYLQDPRGGYNVIKIEIQPQ